MRIKLPTFEQRLAEFNKEWEACGKCIISVFSNNKVNYALHPIYSTKVDVMIMINGPGICDDKTGFYASAIVTGLDLLTNHKHYPIDVSFLLTGVTACRACNGKYKETRLPRYQEAQSCQPRWVRLAELFRPEKVLCVGTAAIEAFDSMKSFYLWENHEDRASIEYLKQLERIEN